MALSNRPLNPSRKRRVELVGASPSAIKAPGRVKSRSVGAVEVQGVARTAEYLGGSGQSASARMTWPKS